MRTRVHVPQQVRRQLFIEAGWKCAVPRCAHEIGLEIHHIDEDPSNNDFENLIILCAIHHAHVTSGVIDRIACKMLKSALKADRLREDAGVVELANRHDVNASLCENIRRTRSYRAILSGPYFLHPDWFYRQRAQSLAHDDFDKLENEFIVSNGVHRSHDIRIICTNSARYVHKISHLVAEQRRKEFQLEVISNIEALWGPSCQSGPDLCCVHPGWMHIVYIFDQAVITQYRVDQMTPTRGGHLHSSPKVIDRERIRFDSVFQQSTRGQPQEVAELKSFITNLWT